MLQGAGAPVLLYSHVDVSRPGTKIDVTQMCCFRQHHRTSPTVPVICFMFCFLVVACEESYRDEGRDGRLCKSLLYFSVPEDPQPSRGKQANHRL